MALVPALLVLSGLGLAGYKAWQDSLPLAKKIRTGDQVRVPVTTLGSSTPPALVVPGAFAILKVLGRSDVNLVCLLEEIVLGDGRLLVIPEDFKKAAFNISPGAVVSAERLGSDGVLRTVT